ncbi:MAG: hypothetical protein IPP57_14405 [Candidatus Obscuribacter sp.]|nr:hypothetical protein [Candidatus Obscuribacter sp.]MBK9200919.1 hypothetical protein [Candidatus Obscuribacter sp.]MBK9621601.1 hypothetical protein [Candidatus Obscuribacter sp.]MBK9771987.1 hypothetical protein [Candidatus Obscuribacter sp.]
MSKKSEVIAARRNALGLRVIVNDAMPAAVASPVAACRSSAPHQETAIHTSFGDRNHLGDGHTMTVGELAAAHGKTAKPAASMQSRVATGRLSLVPVDAH